MVELFSAADENAPDQETAQHKEQLNSVKAAVAGKMEPRRHVRIDQAGCVRADYAGDGKSPEQIKAEDARGMCFIEMTWKFIIRSAIARTPGRTRDMIWWHYVAILGATICAPCRSCIAQKLSIANIFEMRACARLIPNRKSAIDIRKFRGAAAIRACSSVG